MYTRAALQIILPRLTDDEGGLLMVEARVDVVDAILRVPLPYAAALLLHTTGGMTLRELEVFFFGRRQPDRAGEFLVEVGWLLLLGELNDGEVD